MSLHEQYLSKNHCHTQGAWNSVSHFDLAPARSIYTMLSEGEQKLLYYYAQKLASKGDILDLGSHLGGSAARLALGARASGYVPNIHLYDRFRFFREIHTDRLPSIFLSKDYWEADGGAKIVQDLLRPLYDNLHIHQGELSEAKWNGADIALLFIDIAKKTRDLDQIATLFYPSMARGQSVLIQQEMLYEATPWVPVHMELWADKFEFLGCEGQSGVFLLKETISQLDAHSRTLQSLDETDFRKLLLEAARSGEQHGYASAIYAQIDLVDRHGMWERTRALSRKQK